MCPKTLPNVIQMNIYFRWKTYDGKELLMESYHIRLKRIQYLRSLSQYLKDGRPIIYTDESYIHSSHTHTKEWCDTSAPALKKPVSKGKRLIMVHAGGKDGFIPNGLLIFPSGKEHTYSGYSIRSPIEISYLIYKISVSQFLLPYSSETALPILTKFYMRIQ